MPYKLPILIFPNMESVGSNMGILSLVLILSVCGKLNSEILQTEHKSFLIIILPLLKQNGENNNNLNSLSIYLTDLTDKVLNILQEESRDSLNYHPMIQLNSVLKENTNQSKMYTKIVTSRLLYLQLLLISSML